MKKDNRLTIALPGDAITRRGKLRHAGKQYLACKTISGLSLSASFIGIVSLVKPSILGSQLMVFTLKKKTLQQKIMWGQFLSGYAFL